MSSENEQPKTDQTDKVDSVKIAKKGVSGFVKLLTTRHFTRLFNVDSRRGVAVLDDTLTKLKEVKENKQNVDFPCPFCGQVYLTQKNDEQKGWHCLACHAYYPVGGNDVSDLKAYLKQYGREIYLQGKGLKNSAYSRHGFDESSDFESKKQVTTLYFISKILLALAFFILLRLIFLDLGGFAIAMHLFFLVDALAVSVFYAYRGYCLATRQIYIVGYWHFFYWLRYVGLVYFLNVGRRPYLDERISQFEEMERSQNPVGINEK